MNYTRKLKQMKITFIVFALLLVVTACTPKSNRIDLSGEWKLCLDSTNVAQIDQLSFDQSVQLPGTLDDAGIGKPLNLAPELEREVMLHLYRKHEYIGKAWYKKTITVPELQPSTNKSILKMERVMWKSQVYVDGKPAGEANSLCVPHAYDLTDLLTPGEHELLICIDNSRQFDLNNKDMAHAYTEETQIKWNGILGDFAIHFYQGAPLTDIQVFPNFPDQSVSVKVGGSFASGMQLRLAVKDENGETAASRRFEPNSSGNYAIKMDEQVKRWDEFSPMVYTLEATLLENGKTIQTKTETFGFRELQSKGKSLELNGDPLFLRGTLECCIFPLTGHPPVSEAEWMKLYKTAKAYGLNHIRFHSWCPPEAAFSAADKLGVYLQVEAPNWNTKFGEDKASVDFICTEAERIIQAYGNHPSFCFMSMGNELEGDFQRLTDLVVELKKQDKRHLYTTTTFTFQKGHGLYPEPVDDYFITQYTEKGWVRGQGVFDAEYPNFRTDYTRAVTDLPVPLITHEIGQYSVYPNLKEIDKYTGVLEPLNFKAVRKNLEEKGLIHLADDYLKASGNLAKLLYKEEIERALKTVGIAGFQLLDLHDFPGQGTALVGLLDAFWDSKGIVDSTEFKTFCSELVPLIWMEKAVYRNSESIFVEFGVANHFKTWKKQKVELKLLDTEGNVVKKSDLVTDEIVKGETSKLGTAEFKLADFKEAAQYTLRLSLPGTAYTNSWPVWVYPDTTVELNDDQILVTRSFAEAQKALETGKKVLLNPELAAMKGLEGKFVPVFWSPVHFPDQPGTMGLLIDAENPAFSYFPTDYYTNWQWWDLCKTSKTLEFADLPIKPIIRVVDNFFRNRNLTTLFEAKIGEGKLLFSSMDLSENLDKRPAAKQLLYSLEKYMESDAFAPKNSLTIEQLERLESN
ncbi:sugar-binding domain-containing protein [Mangrovibacterium lignilyticum]|uniref:sugar-binding domain-containing protein n=1 Tax=Mangrovibacterium lignilyticum TaxID=2668052 RepID=UPI0019684948|nr:sugar-binding domain-containing protein [Mangrovibacterium lignilyticum]